MRVSKVAILAFVLLSPALIGLEAVAQSSQVSEEQDDACRLWGIIGRPSDMIADIEHHLYGSGPPDYDGAWPQCLKRLGGSGGIFPFDNADGWGIGYYGSLRTPVIHRGQPSAWMDPDFDTAVRDTANVNTRIAVGHVRKGTDPPTPSDGNPHPFHRLRMGSHWLFGHNGWVDRAKVRNLTTGGQNPVSYFRDPSNQWQIPQCHLAHHPDGAGGFRPCEPLSDNDACLFGDIQGYQGSELKGIVDSELYFVYLLKCIENATGNIPIGVDYAVRRLGAAQAIISALNFFLTDGETLWSLCFCRINPDHYSVHFWIPKCKWCGAIASSIPQANSTEWIKLENATLIKLWMENGDAKSQIYPIAKAVGGITVPVDKLNLLAPYIGLASAVAVATAVAIYAKRVKRRQEKQ